MYGYLPRIDARKNTYTNKQQQTEVVLSAISSIFRISVQFDNAKRRYKRYGAVGRTVAFLVQLICVAITAAGAWGISKCLAMIGENAVLIPVILTVLCVAVALVSALWTVLFVIAYTPVLIDEIKTHNANKARQAQDPEPRQDEATAGDGNENPDAPKMSKAGDIIFTVLNLLTLPVAIGMALLLILQL